jgi:sulfoxide reductase catalytic subunit YedY
MISFDAAHEAVHYPKDRRFRIWIRPSIPIWIGVVVLSAIASFWIELAMIGLPEIPRSPKIYPLCCWHYWRY